MKTLLVVFLVVLGIHSAHAERIGPVIEYKLFAPDPQRTGLYGYSTAVNGNLLVVGRSCKTGPGP
jgi:hypothetical protein